MKYLQGLVLYAVTSLLLISSPDSSDAKKQALAESNILTESQANVLPGIWEGFGGTARGCVGEVADAGLSPEGLVYLAVDGESCGELSAGTSLHENIFIYDPAIDEVTGIIRVRLRPSSQSFSRARINSLKFYRGALVIAGSFETVDDQTIRNIARWDGEQWRPLGSLEENGVWTEGSSSSVAAVHVAQERLHVTGRFGMAGGTQANSVAVWDGTNWSAMGQGIRFVNSSDGSTRPGTGRAITSYAGRVYVGGQFDLAGSISVKNIAAWDGSTWSDLGSGESVGTSSTVRDLHVHGDSLYVGGSFTQVGETGNVETRIRANGIARWNGAWHSLDVTSTEGATFNGVDGIVESLASFEGELVVGGSFDEAGFSIVGNVATWNGQRWADLEGGVEKFSRGVPVNVLLPYQAGLLVAGDLDLAGNKTTDNRVWRLATWTGSRWIRSFGVGSGNGLGDDVALRLGFSATTWVSSLANTKDTVLATGAFTRAGNGPATCIAEWNGINWTQTGDQGDSSESTCGDFENGLSILPAEESIYLGFERDLTLGGNKVFAIAKWNGAAWEPLWPDGGSGLSGGVSGAPNAPPSASALIEHEGSIYVGGNFTTASGEPVNHVARWDGAAWHALGVGDDVGVNAWVNDMALFGNEVIVAGAFNRAGSETGLAGVARWDGISWSGLGNGEISGDFEDLEVAGSRLYAGGRFVFADAPDTVELVAVWDGTEWSRLGPDSSEIASDMDRAVSIAVFGNQLYVSGAKGSFDSMSFGRVAFWDGFAWKKLGSQTEIGLTGGKKYFRGAHTMQLSQEGLLLGGHFWRAGGELSKNIARFIPINELDLRLSLEQATAPAQLTSSQPQNITMSSDILVDLVVRNQGIGGVMGAGIELNWSPLPQQVSWTCQPLTEGNAECPAESGTGVPGPTLDLPAGGGLRFTFSLIPAADAVFQDIRALINAEDVIGVTGTTSDSLNVSLPVSAEGVFKDEFE